MTMGAEYLWPPENDPVRVSAIDLRLAEGPHPLYLANRQAIEENWLIEVEANPHLFNGQMVLQQSLTFSNGAICGVANAISYATLLWWRKQPDPRGAYHLFGFAVIVSSDGAIIAIRMSDRTANPGQVYFAAGSLDLNDVIGGRLDLVGNMRREVSEETGLDLGESEAEPHFHASHTQNRVVVFRRHYFSLSAEEIVARIERHMETDEEQEIAGAVIIRSADPSAHAYNELMLPIIDYHFSNPRA